MTIQKIIEGTAFNLPGSQPKTHSGFFDLPKDKTCKHPEHKPPMHINIPQGKGYRHVCPACGAESVLIPPQITY
jgi:hypothetical protein